MKRKSFFILAVTLASLLTGGTKLFAQAMPRVSTKTTTYEYFIQADVQDGASDYYVTNELHDDHIVAFKNSGDYLRVKFVAVEGSTEWKVVPLNVEGMTIIAISGNGNGAAATYYADEAAADAASALKTWMVTSSTICASGSQRGWNRYESLATGLVKLYGWDDSGTQWRFIPANDAALAASGAGYASPLTTYGDASTDSEKAAAYNAWYAALETAPAASDLSLTSGYYYLRGAAGSGHQATFNTYVYNEGENTRGQIPNTSELSKNKYVWKVTREAGSTKVAFTDAQGNGIWGRSELTLGVSDHWKYGMVYFTEGMHFTNQGSYTVNGSENATPAATQSNLFKPTPWAHPDAKASAYYFEPVENVYELLIVHGNDDSYATKTATSETALNGGFFVYEPGTVPSASDFTATDVEGAEPGFAVDTDAKTITLTYTPTIDPTVFALYEKANHCQTLVDEKVYGVRPGLYPDRLRTAANEAIAAALLVENAEGVEAAETALDAAMDALNNGMIQIEDGEVYMVLNGKGAFAEGKSMITEENDLRWGDKDAAKNNNYWMVETVEDGYKFKNGDGTYIALSGSDLVMGTAAEANVVTATQYSEDNWTLNIAGNTNQFHANHHGDDGTPKNLILWGTNSSEPSRWKFAPVSGYDLYEVAVTDNFEGGFATYNSDVAANGGFFVVANGTTPTFAAGEVEGYDGNVSIEGNTVTVTYTLNKAHYQEALVTAVTKAQAVLDLKGAGYPVADAPARGTFETAIGVAHTAATGSTDAIVGNEIATLEEAVEAYKTAALSSDVVMPEDGKAYILMNIFDANQKALYYDTGYDTYAYYTCDVTNIKKVPLNYVFVCHKMSDGQYVFVNNWGGYSALKGNATNVGANSNKGYTAAYDATISGHTVEKGKRFGCLAIKGNRAGGTDTYYVRRNDDNAAFDQAGSQIGADHASCSSDFQFIEYPYPNTPKLNEATIDGDAMTLGTFSAPFATVIPEGVKAFYVEGVNGTTATLKRIQGKAIPANTGVILTAETKTASALMVPATTETVATVSGNMLVASGEGINSFEGYSNAYVLGGKEANGVVTVAFYKASTTSTTLGANKAYLSIDSAAPAFVMSFGNGETTGIEGVEAAPAAQEDAIFDLSGRRVLNPTKGLYIIGGKKVYIK